MSEREILFRGKRKDSGEWVYGDVAHSIRSANGRKLHKSWIVDGYFSNGGWLTPLNRRQWDRLKKGAISDMHDFSQSKRKLSDETKEKLRECAIKQRRINGKFASNIHDNPELLKGE